MVLMPLLSRLLTLLVIFFFQADDGIRAGRVTGVQTCALPIYLYPDGRKWPKTTYRRLWTWLTRPLAERARRHIPPPRSARWCGGHHLPGMFRAEFGWDLYTRMCVPVEEHRTRVWYYHCTRPKTAAGRLWDRLVYAAVHR